MTVRGSYRKDDVHVLPTGGYMNPMRPDEAEYWDISQVAYTLYKVSEKRTRPTRVITSYGPLGLDLGDELHLWHEQTGASLGTYRVVGIFNYKPGLIVGDVPDRKFRHSVVK